MNVNFPLLFVAVLLLFVPRQWLRGGRGAKRKRRSADAVRSAAEPWNSREPSDPRLKIGTEFSKFRNYVDFLRAGVASLALAGGAGLPSVITFTEGAPSSAIWSGIALRTAILVVGLLLQTLRYEKSQITFWPPIFYIAGLSLGLCDIYAGIAAFVFIWAIHVLFGGAQGFLITYSVVIVVFGHLFARQGDLSVILAGILCFLPVLLSLLAHRPLNASGQRNATAQT